MSWTVWCYPRPQICSTFCHYIFCLYARAEDDTPIWLPGEHWPTKAWHVCRTVRQEATPHRYTCEQIIAKGGQEHEVLGNGRVTNSFLIQCWLQIDHVLILIASGTCTRSPTRKYDAYNFREKWPHKIEHTNGRKHAMDTQPTLPSSPGHLLLLIKGPIFMAIMLSKRSAFVSVLGNTFSCEWFQLLIQMWVEHRRGP